MSIPPDELPRLLESLVAAEAFRTLYPDGYELHWEHEDLGDSHQWTIRMLPIGDPVEVCHGSMHRYHADLRQEHITFCGLAKGHGGRCKPNR